MHSKRLFLFVLSLVLAFSCTEKEETISFIPYRRQPTVPMYDQMLLKGDVFSVTTRRIKREGPGGKGIEQEYVEFDESHWVTKFIWDDVEMETGPDSGCLLSNSFLYPFAYFEYPNRWRYVHSVTMTEGDYSLLEEWDDEGRYIQMRYSHKGEPVKVDALDDYELEKYLYDENGYPHYCFVF